MRLRSVARAFACAFLLAPLVAVFVLAQDKKDSPDKGKGILDRRPTQQLGFGEAPKDWKAQSSEGAKSFLCDYDLPAAEGDAEAPRVNVLFFPLGFEDYRAKILGSWTKANGDALKLDDQKLETLADGELKLRLIEESGTYTHKGEKAKPGFKLLAVHMRRNGEQWTAWLIGPEKSVEKNRDAYLAWVKTARVEEQTEAVREVRFVHGAPAHGVPGPWALSAYRIGKDALHRLGISREKSWEIVVTHRAPKEVRYSCMLDGLLAATGASPGKLNLIHEPVEGEEQLATVVLHKPTHRTLTYTLTKSYRDKIRELDSTKFPEAAKELDAMKDEEVFRVEEGTEQGK